MSEKRIDDNDFVFYSIPDGDGDSVPDDHESNDDTGALLPQSARSEQENEATNVAVAIYETEGLSVDVLTQPFVNEGAVWGIKQNWQVKHVPGIRGVS